MEGSTEAASHRITGPYHITPDKSSYRNVAFLSRYENVLAAQREKQFGRSRFEKAK